MTLYRPADLAPDSEDRAFIISAWSSSYKSSHFAGLIASEDWPAIMHRQLGRILDWPGTTALVAGEPDGFLYGFIAGDTSRRLPIVYYVYVKDPFRSQEEIAPSGVVIEGRRSGPRYARGLFAALGVDPAQPFLYTCRTSVVSRIGDNYPGGTNKIPNAKFAPAAARYANYQEPHGQRRP